MALLHVFPSCKTHAEGVSLSLHSACAHVRKRENHTLALKASIWKWHTSLLLTFHWPEQATQPSLTPGEQGSVARPHAHKENQKQLVNGTDACHSFLGPRGQTTVLLGTVWVLLQRWIARCPRTRILSQNAWAWVLALSLPICLNLSEWFISPIFNFLLWNSTTLQGSCED